MPPELNNHNYSKASDLGIIFDLQYADDICWVGSNFQHGIDRQKDTILAILVSRNLKINGSKTEEYTVTTDNSEWRRCKYLESLLDSTEDIKQRKTLAVATLNKLHAIFRDKKLRLKLKLRIFNSLVSTIFIYNSELWTITKTNGNTIDSFHRRLLRKVMHIRYPQTITNEELYQLTKQVP